MACASGMICGIRQRLRYSLVTLALSLTAGPLIADPGPPPSGNSPVEWLARMSNALTHLEYEGTIVYLHGHELSTLRIAHRIDNGQPRESLLALSGPVSAVARGRQGVTCVLPDAHAISVPRHAKNTQSTLHPGPFDVERLRRHYLIHPLGRSRIAGRDTEVIGIIPKDDLRYGYRFFVDDETGLPLKTDLMDSSATPIEQVMFTEVEFLEDDWKPEPSSVAEANPATDLRPTQPSPKAAQASLTVPTNEAQSTGAGFEVDTSPWTMSGLPPGYRVVADDRSHGAGTSGRRWFMVSDGLSVVSVYIESDGDHGLAGERRVGAVNAAGRSLEGHQITVVGEAPAQTVRAISEAISLASSERH